MAQAAGSIGSSPAASAKDPVGPGDALGEQVGVSRPVHPRRGEEAPRGDVRLRLDLGNVANTMRGGIGASWHAIEKPLPYSEQPDPVFQIKSHGGSGWGAYPPAGDQAARDQIDRHARWLGLDFNRVEIEQRIHEPEQGRFTWYSPEMLILYKILDWCERNRADVFLQQMWSNVRWNAYPEWREDTAGRIHSAPHNLDAFAEGLAALVEHLVRNKGYTCIRWLCITNEPGNRFSWWQRPPPYASCLAARTGGRPQGTGRARAENPSLRGRPDRDDPRIRPPSLSDKRLRLRLS